MRIVFAPGGDGPTNAPASGWEKGHLENQVGLVRERFFKPRLRFKPYDELNAWLLDKRAACARAHRHVDQHCLQRYSICCTFRINRYEMSRKEQGQK